MKKSDKIGCISEKDGKYMLMDKAHPNGVELMSSDDLKPHVDNSMKHEDMGMMTMKVGDMKMISDRCEMSTMSK